jgi:hypothetical protein
MEWDRELKSRLNGNAGFERIRSLKVGLKVVQVLKRSGSGLGVESSRLNGDSSFEAIGS